jgi:hypothetical protein
MDSLYFYALYASRLVYIHDLKHFNLNRIIKGVDYWIKSTDRHGDYFVK